jgi:hypothetical protein
VKIVIDRREVDTKGLGTPARHALAAELGARVAARALEGRWRKALLDLLRLGAVALAASGCAGLHQHPRPVGEPSPLACYGAKRTREAWELVVREYVDEMMAAQEVHSCTPPQPMSPHP